MAMDSTALRQEIQTVLDSTDAVVNYNITAQICAAGVWINPVKLDYYGCDRDYEDCYGDYTTIEFQMLMGDYTYDLVPARQDVLVDITYTPLSTTSKTSRSDVKTQVLRYRGVLIDQLDDRLTNKNSQASSRAALNQLGVKVIRMQLIDETLYLARFRTMGRNFKLTSPIDALRTALIETMQLQSGSSKRKILGINVAEGYNKDIRNQIIVPHNTPLLKVPQLIQDREGGVYPTGLGCYLQDQYWWVYPLYDTKLVFNRQRSLTVYNVPSNRYDGAERTVRVTDDRVIVLATGQADSLDLSSFNQLNGGNGTRFADTRRLFNGFVTGKQNRMLVDRALNVFEVVSSTMDGINNNVQWSDTPFTSNPFKEYTDLAYSDGRVVEVVWNHGNIDYLLPGMPTIYRTVNDSSIDEYKGVLLGVSEQRAAAETGPVTRSYPASVRLKIFICKQIVSKY